MSRAILPFLIVAALVALVAFPAAADPKRGEGFDFGPVPGAPQPEGTPSEATPAAPSPAADDPVQREILELAYWPNARGVRAAESLLLRGPDVVPAMLDVLTRDPTPSQPGAAWVLGRLGEPAHVVAILRAAAMRRNGSKAEVFFEAAYDLEPKKTKDWLFSFLPLRRPVFRAKATDFLLDHVGPEDRTRVLRLLDAPKPGVRVSGMRLMEPAKVEDAEVRLIHALSDPASEVALTASVLLALRSDEALVERLNEVAIDGHARERAYATLALVEVARIKRQSPFSRRTLTELAGRRGLLHPEKLVRGASALGLAYGALETNDDQLGALLDRTVVDVLIDTVGGDHFRDYDALVKHVFSALRKLSGLDLPATAVAWANWWRMERETFQARRPLEAVSGSDMPFAYVRFDAVEADGGRRQATFRSEDGTPQSGEYALSRDAFRSLIGALEDAGLFETDASDQPRADEHVLVTVGVMNQKRSLVVPFSDPKYALFRLRMRSLEEANLWQRYRDADRWPNAAEWWKVNAQQMAEADPATRIALLKAAIVHSYDDLPSDAARAEALDRLEDLRREDEDAGSLSAAEVKALVEAATASISFADLEVRAVTYAMDHGSAVKVRGDLVEALAERREPSARALLAELLALGGPAELRSAFADARTGMRGAAARAAEMLIEEGRLLEPAAFGELTKSLQPGLEVLARDEDARVAIRAVVALDKLGAGGGVDQLEELYNAGTLDVKVAVAEALGNVPAEQAFPLISRLLAEERRAGAASLRAAALESLARTQHPRSVGLLTFYLLNDPDISVQAAAGDALVRLGSDDARFALIRALTEGQPAADRRARLVDVLGHFEGKVVQDVLLSYLEDRDPGVASAATLRLADQNVASTVPYLIVLARGSDPALAQQAVRALENLSCLRYDMQGHDLLAEQYERWYQAARVTSAGEPDRAWFRDALRDLGYDVGPLTPYVAGEADPMAVPVLIRALRDEDPVIRRGAAIALRRVTGLSLGDVDRSTSLRDAGAVAVKWARWWERVQGAGGGGR